MDIYSDRLSAGYIKAITPELIISYNYNYLISQECIDAAGERIINMHISFLPWNRGFSPNIWSFIDNTPKGVTIHMLSEGLDEGDILFQKKVEFAPEVETFQTTYNKLNSIITQLFKDNWDKILSGEYTKLRKKQPIGGSFHCIEDLRQLRHKVCFAWDDNIADFLGRYEQQVVNATS